VHLSPDAPAVDFCLAAHGTTTFTGPVLKGAGDTAGITYPSATKYLSVPAGQYDVRIVAPNAADCSTSLASLPDYTSLPALAAGGSFTIAAEGLVASGASNPFGLAAYVDDATVTSGQAALRFVHASPGTPAVDVGTLSGSTFSAVFSDVAFGAVAPSGGGIDANGYLVTMPLSSVELAARAHAGTTNALTISDTSLPAGAIATAFAIGEIGSTTAPLAALLCVDNAAPTGALSACSVVGDINIRVAHLSPDAPAVDVCVKPHSSSTWPATPLLASLGTAAGLSYPQVTTYVNLAATAYDVRIVAAPATSCTTGVVPDTTNVTIPAAVHATVAATGDLTVAGSDPGFALKVYVDETTVASGSGSLRFIHASPSTPAVDVGTLSGSTFSAIFSDVAFGTVAASGGGIDANGYLVTTPLSGVELAARAHGSTANALTVSGVSLAAGEIATAFAIGGKTGQSTNPLQVLLCDDSAAPTGVLTTCLAPAGTP
jgi:hypothetical protein